MERRAAVIAPCPICGSTEYTWGSLLGQIGYSRDKDFSQSKSVDAGQFNKVRNERLRTRLCHNCGNVQLFDPIHPIDFDGTLSDNER